MANITYSFDRDKRPRKRGNGPRAVLWVLLSVGAAVLIVLGFYSCRGKKSPAKPAAVRTAGKPAEKTAGKPARDSFVEVQKLQRQAELAVGELERKNTAALADAPVVPESGSLTQGEFAGLLEKCRNSLAEKDPVAAKKLALDALAKGNIARNSEAYRALGKVLGEANLYILFKGVPSEKTVKYVIQPGDSLYLIAIKFKLPADAIRKANNLPENSQVIHPGQVLRIYQGDWRIEVGKDARLLAVFDGKELFKLYDIGIGKEGRTPAGTFVVADKIKNPAWYAPDGRIVPFGEKENVLGTRWFKLKPVGETDPFNIGYGIHGTWDEGSITRSLSNGCVRMRNADVEELFEYIPRQTPVLITD